MDGLWELKHIEIRLKSVIISNFDVNLLLTSFKLSGLVIILRILHLTGHYIDIIILILNDGNCALILVLVTRLILFEKGTDFVVLLFCLLYGHVHEFVLAARFLDLLVEERLVGT